MKCDLCGNFAKGEVYRIEGVDATYTQCFDKHYEACRARGREILERFYGRDFNTRTHYRYHPKGRPVTA